MSERKPLPAPEEFATRRIDHLRVTDIDFQGHVNNAIFANLLASARYDYLGAHIRPHLGQAATLVVATTTITYTAEMTYGAEVDTRSRVLGLGRSSMQLEQIILQRGRICGHALTTMVHRTPEGSAAWPDPVKALQASTAQGGI